MESWTDIAAVDEIPAEGGVEFVVGDQVIALFRAGGEVFALDGVCPHQGGPLGKGELLGYTVTCPWHGWQFDLRTGENAASPSVRQRCLPVRIEQGRILVRISQGET